MKRLTLIAIVCSAGALPLNAQDVEGRKGLSEQENAERSAVVTKYDTDGDGVLSKSEQKGLSKDEKKTLAKTGGVGTSSKASVEAETKAKNKDVQARADLDASKAKDRPSNTSNASSKGNGGKNKGGKK